VSWWPFPLYVTFVASTLTYEEIVNVPMPLVPGDQMIENYSQVLEPAGLARKGLVGAGGTMLFNSLVMALGVAIGKIAISILSASRSSISASRCATSSSG
jgi:sn-glycerol 3-phosphate transport system permease protein